MYPWQEILFRLTLASAFGALIGLEREQKDRAAGLRTYMMVSLGSALIMMVSAFGFSDILGKDHVVLDPSRVAAQVISGIGFIGAETMLFLNQQIEETKGINYLSYSANKTGSQLSIQLKFDSFDPKKLPGFINVLQQKPEIHKIFLSKE